MNNSRNNFLGDGALGDAVNSAVNVLNNGKATTFTNAMNNVGVAATNVVNNVGLAATNVVNNLAAPTNSVNKTFTNAVNAVGTTAANAANSVGATFTNAVNAVGTTAANAANSVGATFTNAVNSVGANALGANALGANALGTNAVGANKSNIFNVFKNSNLNKAAPFLNNSSMMNYELLIPISIFVALVTAFGLLFYFFTTEIKTGYDNLSKTVQSVFGTSLVPAPAPAPASDHAPDHALSETPIPQSQSILEKVLPLNRSAEVFNVNKNDFTYYDAEPLCKALGAELATYDQVKDAYGKGADWCNYGWVKGQVAIYPTQKATWDEIQKGDGSERDACGKPGVNGGYFDNPEMKFGVNCYGPKPSQSDHDEAQLMKQGRIPMTTSALKTEQKVKEFEAQANSLGIMPFNKNNWQSN
jgi:Extracellular link domain